MQDYKQFSTIERELIYEGLALHKSHRQIAKELGRNHSSISRELIRNSDPRLGYLPDRADLNANGHKRRNISKIASDSVILDYVKSGLEQYWSPEEIAGRLMRERRGFYVCSETIYAYIYKQDKELCKLLPQRRARRIRTLDRKPHPADANDQQLSIKHRDKAVYKRTKIGHWEGDTIFFTHRTTENLSTMVERKSRYTIAIKNRRKDWSETLGQIRDRLKELPEAARQTLTLDRGIEFRHPQCLTSNMSIGVYYCDGGSPWQKGTVENTNGRMRRWLPKNYEIENLNQEGIDRIIEIMNNTPRKCLKYRTPNEVFSKFLSNCCT